MGLPALRPSFFGATMVLRGIPDFTRIPPSSRLQDEDSGTTLTVDMENRPCHLVSKEIEAAHPGCGKAFKPAATGRRGVTAWVEREGEIRLGARFACMSPISRSGPTCRRRATHDPAQTTAAETRPPHAHPDTGRRRTCPW
jgi:MOSC domain-containing protein YiiM